MSMLTTCLWFREGAAEAAAFYVSVFPRSRVTETAHYPPNAGSRAGSVVTVAFELDGRPFVALNGGTDRPFSETVSLQVACADQDEIDRYWTALLVGGGEESQCGWLRDRFGFSWQVVPSEPIFRDGDSPEANARVGDALQGMAKLDLGVLEAARRGDRPDPGA